MKYSEYIRLGFSRTNIEDPIEFKETGIYGFILEKQISEKALISVHWLELDKPKLYVLKTNKHSEFHILPLTCEVMIDLINSLNDAKIK